MWLVHLPVMMTQVDYEPILRKAAHFLLPLAPGNLNETHPNLINEELPEVGAGTEIIDAGQRPPTDGEVRDVVQMESRPEVMEWEDEPIGDPDDPERSFKLFKGSGAFA